MSEILFQYQKVEPTTWAYLSSLLIIGLYFKFNRFWSVRNLDLCLIILLAPGLLMVYYGEQLAYRTNVDTATATGADPVLPAPVLNSDPVPPARSTSPNSEAGPVPDGTLPEKSEANREAPDRQDKKSPAASPAPGENLPATARRHSGDQQTDSEEWVSYLPTGALSPGDEYAFRPVSARDQAKRLETVAIQDGSSAEVAPSQPVDPPNKAANESSPVSALSNLQPRDNAALAGLPKLSPDKARGVMHFGYLWLLGVSLLLMIRLLCDPTMVRRPLLEPNLSNGGLLFIGCALLFFLMANVLTSDVSTDDLSGLQGANNLTHQLDSSSGPNRIEDYRRFGPGYYLLNTLPSIPTLPFNQLSSGDPRIAFAPAARTMAIISHLSVVIALVIVGLWHFDNIKLGIGAAALYLMLPYTAQMTGHVDHVLPSALMLWAIVFYRRPALAGIFIGLSVGVVYYPIFLLPLWISFYWQRGVVRFLLGLIGAIVVTAISLAFVSEDMISFWSKIRQMFGLFLPNMDAGQLRGVWERSFGWDPIFRLPCIAASICLSASFAFWPAQKNLGTLLSCSAAMMLAVQFWHGYGGGTYIAWFMPLMLLTIFRPNLEDRIALTVLGEGWLSKRRTRPPSPLVGRAAFIASSPEVLRPNS